MNEEWKNKWVKALRSGEYKRTTGTLRSQKLNGKGEEYCAYCCLGVLTDVVLKETGRSDAWDDLYYKYKSVLSDDIMKITGVNNCSGEFVNCRGVTKSLADLNDGGFETKGLSFNKIADIIENNWEAI